MTPEQLKQLHEAELKVLKVLIEVCDKLKLPYFAVFGTALGVVRHKGFIPWDDDIDVGMLRRDFTRFVREAPALLPEGYILQYRDTDPKYCLLHAKLVDENTAFFEPGTENATDGHHGVFVDIFPWDYFPTKGLSAQIFKMKKRFYQNLMCIDPVASYWQRKGLKHKVYALLQPFVNLLYPNRQTLARKFDAVLEKLPAIPTIGCHDTKTRYNSTEWFTAVKTMPFEHMEISVPVGIHEHLTAYFGDYMQLPPVEERVPIHVGGIIDLDRPYTVYLERNKLKAGGSPQNAQS